MTYEKIIQELKKKIYHPVYFLWGDEPYYIDLICDYLEKNVLSESEKEFNQSVLYGKDIDVLTLLSYAKRYPMMSNHQVVIVKEAQDIRNLTGTKEKGDKKDDKQPFLEYLQQPQKSTILVLCYKYKAVDGRTKFYKEIEKNGAVFQSQKIKDYKLGEWITDHVQSLGHRINPKAAAVIGEYLGSDLSKIANEINKLLLNVGTKTDEINLDHVENNIGISKEFNVFELTKSLSTKNVYKANQIANYFASNQKNNPLMMTIPNLYAYFMKVLAYHRLPVKSKEQAASALGVNPYFVQEYETAARSYPEDKVVNIISYIRDYDMRLKGVNNGSVTEGALLKELLFKILH